MILPAHAAPPGAAPSLDAPALPNTRRAVEFVAPHRRAITRIIAVALVLAACNAATPLVLKYLFDTLAAPGARLAPLVAGVLVLLAVEIGIALLTGRLDTWTWDVRLAVDFGVRGRVIEKLKSLPVAYHQQQTVGGTMTSVNAAITAFVSAFGELAFKTIPAVAYLLLALAAMLRLDWRLTLVVLVLTPLPPLLGAWAAPEQTERERKLVRRWSTLYGRLNEVLAGIRTVKGFAMERDEMKRFLDGVHQGNEIVRMGARTDARTIALQGLAATLARVLAVSVGGWLVLRGEVTVGTLIAFLGYVGGIFGPLQGLTGVYQMVRKATVSLETIYGIIDAPDAVADLPAARSIPISEGAVEFHEVSFSYEPGRYVLHRVSLHVRAGEKIALVGPSGSGKTTLVSLLERLYPLTEGHIKVDGVDVRDLTQESLRRQIGTVFQDVHLFNDTIFANIAYGQPGATPDDVEVAARAANAHEFILRLPDAYWTEVGERGGMLSGGQRQRIAIARAILKNPPILILDEATSALDNESEALVQAALRTLTVGRTTFVVAHRLSTVVDADRIVVLRNGRIEAIGKHEELLAQGGYYASLFERHAHGGLVRVA